MTPAEWVVETRTAQGLPAQLTDVATIKRVHYLLATAKRVHRSGGAHA